MNNNPHITFLRPVYIIYMSLAGLPAARAAVRTPTFRCSFYFTGSFPRRSLRRKWIDLGRPRFSIFFRIDIIEWAVGLHAAFTTTAYGTSRHYGITGAKKLHELSSGDSFIIRNDKLMMFGIRKSAVLIFEMYFNNWGLCYQILV